MKTKERLRVIVWSRWITRQWREPQDELEINGVLRWRFPLQSWNRDQRYVQPQVTDSHVRISARRVLGLHAGINEPVIAMVQGRNDCLENFFNTVGEADTFNLYAKCCVRNNHMCASDHSLEGLTFNHLRELLHRH